MSYDGRQNGSYWTTVSNRRGRRRRQYSPERYTRPTSTYRGRDGSQNHRGNFSGERRTGRERSPWRARAPARLQNAPRSPHLRRSPYPQRRRTYASVTRIGLPVHDRVSPRRYRSPQHRGYSSPRRREMRAPEADIRRGADGYSASRYRGNDRGANYRLDPPRRVDRVHRGASPTLYRDDFYRRNSPRRSRYRNNSGRRAAPAYERWPRRRYIDTRKRRWDDRQQTSDRPEQRRREDNKPKSDDPDFALKCHVIHRIIKTVHHSSNVSTDKTPVSIDKMMTQLITSIKPAIPSPQTSDLILGNAKNWAHTTLVILRDHYDRVLENELEQLYTFRTPDWRAPFEIASNWAKRHFGRRLTPATLTETEEIITLAMRLLRERTGSPTPGDSAPAGRTTTDPLLQGQGSSSTAAMTRITVQAQAYTAATDVSPPLLQTPAHTSDPTTDEDELPTRTRPLFTACSESDLRVIEDTQDGDLPMLTPHLPDPLPQRVRSMFARGPRNTLQSTLPLLPPPSSPHPPTQGNSCVADDAGSIHGLSPSQRTVLQDEGTRGSVGRPSTMDSTILTPGAADTLHAAAQLTPAPTLAPLFTSQTAGLIRPSRHMSSSRKTKDWHLNIHRKWVIIGDSNAYKLPPHNNPDLQIDSFPGATFRHAEGILENTTVSITVEKIIMSFGICNREQKAKETTIKQLQSMMRVAKLNFPEADIIIPQVNFSNSLPARQKISLTHLNTYIALLGEHIPLLPSTQFKTEADHVHWTHETALAMFDHWCSHLHLN